MKLAYSADKWKDPKDTAIRSECLNILAKLYSEVPLIYCDAIYTTLTEITELINPCE